MTVKIGLISDVHAAAGPLQEALRIFGEERVEAILCAGDIAGYGTEKGLRMCLATNGTLVNESVCTKIKEVDIKMVSLSLDGAKPETHDDFRSQPGAFDRT